MSDLIVAGIGTEVGKTVVSAILATLLNADYWKPIQSGEDTDTDTMSTLLDLEKHKIFPPAYSFKAPLSPHHAARLEKCRIDPSNIKKPITNKPLIIEMAGGILVPLNENLLSLDLFSSWNASWVVVSKHYLGSINHTLLTLEQLKRSNISVLGIIFNGEPNLDSEKAIMDFSQIPCLGRVLPQKEIHLKTIQQQAEQWQQFGILSHR